mmetsp:Transcript_21576/g.73162  ORF Transcript_21576/g.73162 Transcript_21576/m.73162 type:complete len:225 (-) Transcript_21576:780-1454(-)
MSTPMPWTSPLYLTANPAPLRPNKIRVDLTPSRLVSASCSSFQFLYVKCSLSSPSAGFSTSMTLYAISPRDVFICWRMLMPASPNRDMIVPSIPGLLSFTTVMRVTESDRRGKAQVGKLTEWRIDPVSKKSRIVSAAIEAAFSSASSVDAPRCGMLRTFARLSNTGGSAKSQMYLPVDPASNLCAKASASTSSPLAKLRMQASFFSCAISGSPMRWCVSFMYGA